MNNMKKKVDLASEPLLKNTNENKTDYNTDQNTSQTDQKDSDVIAHQQLKDLLEKIQNELPVDPDVENGQTTLDETAINQKIEELKKILANKMSEEDMKKLIEQLEKEAKNSPTQKNKGAFYVLSTLCTLAILSEILYEKFTWDTLKQVMESSNFLLLRILVITGDSLANILSVDFSDSPKTILNIWFGPQKPREKKGWLDWLVTDVLPYSFPLIHYLAGAVADIAGNNTLFQNKILRYSINSLVCLLVPIYYYAMYAEPKEKFRADMHKWFTKTSTATEEETPLAWKTRMIRLYDFLKQALIYSSIRMVSFSFLAKLMAEMLAGLGGHSAESYMASFLNIFTQILVAIGTATEIINSQLPKMWEKVYTPTENNKDFLNFFTYYTPTQRDSIAHCLFPNAVGVALSALPGYLLYNLITTQVNWGDSEGLKLATGILLGSTPLSAFLPAENIAQRNRDAVEVFNRHKDITKKYADLKQKCASIQKVPVTNITKDSLIETYSKTNELISYFSPGGAGYDLLQKAEPKVQKSVNKVIAALMPLKNEFDALLDLADKQKKQTKEIPAENNPFKAMYDDIAELKQAAPSEQKNPSLWQKAKNSAKSAVSLFANVGTQSARQLMLIEFFRSVSKSFGFHLDYKTIIAAVFSIGTANSLANGVVYQGLMETGLNAWGGRIKTVASYFFPPATVATNDNAVLEKLAHHKTKKRG